MQLNLSNALRWLHERAWPLTFFALCVPGVSLLHFAQQERIPIPISALIKVLPILMGLEVFIVASLLGTILLPTTLLLTPIKKNNQEKLIDLWPEYPSNTKNRIRGAEFAVTRYLFFTLCYFSITIFAIMFFLDPAKIPANGVLNNACIVLFLAVPVLGLYCFIKRKLARHHIALRETSGMFWIIAVGSVLVQFLLMIGIVTLSGRGATGSEHEWVIFILYVLIAMCALWVFQYSTGSALVSITRSSQSIERLILSAIILITLPLIIPQTGAKIASTALQIISAGGRSCVILTWADKNITLGYQEISITSHKSKPLRSLFEVDDIYRLREYQTTSEKVYFIPLSVIASMEDCKENQTENTMKNTGETDKPT